MPNPPETEESRPAQAEDQAATSEQKNTTAEDSSTQREVPAWLAALAETARRRLAQRQTDRAEFAERRAHGLRARARTKLRRAGDRDDG